MQTYICSQGNRRTIFDMRANQLAGIPDGMCIDNKGNLWVATFGGGKVKSYFKLQI